jgi:ATP synthase protein I
VNVSDRDPKDRLAALEARLAEKRGKTERIPSAQGQYHSQAEVAWRMVSELVAGLLVGIAIGFGLDFLLGTGPWLMVVFTLLGVAAGMLSVVRSAREMQRRQESGGEDAADRSEERMDDGD